MPTAMYNSRSNILMGTGPSALGGRQPYKHRQVYGGNFGPWCGGNGRLIKAQLSPCSARSLPKACMDTATESVDDGLPPEGLNGREEEVTGRRPPADHRTPPEMTGAALND